MEDQKKIKDPEELLTVKEFAQITGVSTQTIYKQLSTRLQPYLVTVNNVRKLRKTALYEVFRLNDYKPDATKEPTQEPTLQLELSILKEQIKQAHDREKSLQNTIDNLSRLLEQQQQLTAQQQALCLADKQKILELEDKIKDLEELDPDDQEQQEPEKGLWSKLKDIFRV